MSACVEKKADLAMFLIINPSSSKNNAEEKDGFGDDVEVLMKTARSSAYKKYCVKRRTFVMNGIFCSTPGPLPSTTDIYMPLNISTYD